RAGTMATFIVETWNERKRSSCVRICSTLHPLHRLPTKARLTIGRGVAAVKRQKVRGPSLRWDPPTARAVPGLRPNRISSMNGLPVQREIETLALHLVGDTQSDEDVDDLEDDQRHDGVVDEDDDDAFDLVDDLHRVALDQPGRTAVLL